MQNVNAVWSAKEILWKGTEVSGVWKSPSRIIYRSLLHHRESKMTTVQQEKCHPWFWLSSQRRPYFRSSLCYGLCSTIVLLEESLICTSVCRHMIYQWTLSCTSTAWVLSPYRESQQYRIYLLSNKGSKHNQKMENSFTGIIFTSLGCHSVMTHPWRSFVWCLHIWLAQYTVPPHMESSSSSSHWTDCCRPGSLLTDCLMSAVFMMAFLSLYALGSEEGAVFPPVPGGVFAPGRVCLHGGHVALPLRLHHHIHSASQVRRKCRSINLSCNHVLAY